MKPLFQHILFSTHFSDLSSEALSYVRGLTSAFSPQLHCLHVVDDAYQYWSAMGPEGIPYGPPREELLALGEARMKKFVQQNLTEIEPPPVSRVILGQPFVEIIAYAREQRIDLILMATHGRGALSQMLLGSTTEKVVRKAPCPVLTIRPQHHRFEMP